MLKLSIITVCRNNRQGLEATILSVVKQSYSSYEFIIVDGASDDGTIDLIKQYESQIDWWVSEKDSGIYNAMNKGIQKATGEYCLFLNSGDCLSSTNILEKVFAEDHKADIVYGNLIRKKGDRNYRITQYPDKLTLYNFFAPIPSIHHQASFIKRSLFDKFGFYREDFKIISDWEFFFKAIILNNCTTKHIEQNITIFDSFGISSNSNYSESKERIQILNNHFPPRVIEDYINFTNSNKGRTLNFKNTLLQNKFTYKLARMLYLPLSKLKSYITYLRVKK